MVMGITKQFSQGVVKKTDNPLDLAILGSGLFVFNSDVVDEPLYSRSGNLILDRDGYVVNNGGDRLQVLLVDENGNLTEEIGDLQIQNLPIPPKATTSLEIGINLDSHAIAPILEFTANFSTSSYNNSAATEIYDSQGIAHTITNYFIKAPAHNQWQMHISIDGVHVTEDKACTLVFDDSGNFINYDFPNFEYYGDEEVLSKSAVADIFVGEDLPVLAVNEFSINGVNITIDSTDANDLSTKAILSSANTIANAINRFQVEHKIQATVNPTILDLPNGIFIGSTVLCAGEFVINDIDISGTINSVEDLLTAISSNIPGLIAELSGSGICLIAEDGRNIHVKMFGTTGAASNFILSSSNDFGYTLDTNGGGAELVVRSNFTLDYLNKQADAIKISGSAPEKVGLSSGTYRGYDYTNSDRVYLEYNGLNIEIDLSNCTSYGSCFSIYTLRQNGYSSGKLTDLSVDESGVINLAYGNGQLSKLGRVILADFMNLDALEYRGCGMWSETFDSGKVILDVPGKYAPGSILSKSLEELNSNPNEEKDVSNFDTVFLEDLLHVLQNFKSNFDGVLADVSNLINKLDNNCEYDDSFISSYRLKSRLNSKSKEKEVSKPSDLLGLDQPLHKLNIQ